MSESDKNQGLILTESSPSDLIYGIRRCCIADHLTVNNWLQKGLWRMSLMGPVYININKSYQYENEPEPPCYEVRFTRVREGGVMQHVYIKFFDTLEEAVAYANDDDSYPVGRLTRPALPYEIPAEQAPGVQFIMKPGLVP